jgi:hypothetical protein
VNVQADREACGAPQVHVVEQGGDARPLCHPIPRFATRLRESRQAP